MTTKQTLVTLFVIVLIGLLIGLFAFCVGNGSAGVVLDPTPCCVNPETGLCYGY